MSFLAVRATTASRVAGVPLGFLEKIKNEGKLGYKGSEVYLGAHLQSILSCRSVEMQQL